MNYQPLSILFSVANLLRYSMYQENNTPFLLQLLFVVWACEWNLLLAGLKDVSSQQECDPFDNISDDCAVKACFNEWYPPALFSLSCLFGSCPVPLEEISPLYCWWLSRIDYLPERHQERFDFCCLLMMKFANSFAYLWLVYLQCHSSGLTYNTMGKINYHYTFSLDNHFHHNCCYDKITVGTAFRMDRR